MYSSIVGANFTFKLESLLGGVAVELKDGESKPYRITFQSFEEKALFVAFIDLIVRSRDVIECFLHV